MFGAHLSIAGGLHNALIEGERLGCDCVQVFTKNQRQWAVPPLRDEQVAEWDRTMQQTGLRDVVSHDSYLINVASPKEETRRKSVELYRDEIERCEALSIPHLVIHPGAHLGEGEDAAIRRIGQAIDRIHRELPGYRTLTCLENTAGQGTNVGYDLDHLRRIIEAVAEPERLAVCIDTAHALEAGYPLTDAIGARRFLRAVDRSVGLDRVKAMHANDSKTPFDSRKDRHEHIGHGYVAADAFTVLLSNGRLKRVPKVLETPKGHDPHGREWDAVNLAALRELAARPATRRRAAAGRS